MARFQKATDKKKIQLVICQQPSIRSLFSKAINPKTGAPFNKLTSLWWDELADNAASDLFDKQQWLLLATVLPDFDRIICDVDAPASLVKSVNDRLGKFYFTPGDLRVANIEVEPDLSLLQGELDGDL